MQIADYSCLFVCFFVCRTLGSGLTRQLTNFQFIWDSRKMPLILLTIPLPSAMALPSNTWLPNAVDFGVPRWTPVTSVDVINTTRSLSHPGHCGRLSAFDVRLRGGTTRHPRSPIATHLAWCNKHNEVTRDQPVRAAFTDTQLAAISWRQFHTCLRCKHDNDATVGGRTYSENVYLSGRHRQKWQYARISSRPAFTIQQEESNDSQYGHLEATPPRCRRAALHHATQTAGSYPDLLVL